MRNEPGHLTKKRISGNGSRQSIKLKFPLNSDLVSNCVLLSITYSKVACQFLPTLVTRFISITLLDFPLTRWSLTHTSYALTAVIPTVCEEVTFGILTHCLERTNRGSHVCEFV